MTKHVTLLGIKMLVEYSREGDYASIIDVWFLDKYDEYNNTVTRRIVHRFRNKILDLLNSSPDDEYDNSDERFEQKYNR